MPKPSPKKITPGQAAAKLVKDGVFPSPAPAKRAPSLGRSLKAYLRKNPEYLEQIVMGMVHKARMGDHKVLEMLWERLDGAVVKRAVVETEHHIKRYGFLEPPRLVIPEINSDADPDEGDALHETKEVG